MGVKGMGRRKAISMMRSRTWELPQQEEVKEHVQVGRPVVCVEQATDALLQDALRWKRRMATTCR